MSEEVLDLKEVMDRVQDDKELLLELFDIFVGDYAEKRKLLEKAVNGNDIEQVVSIAHSLKGATGNISAKVMRGTFTKLESMGKTGSLAGAKESLVQLDQQFSDLQNRMNQVRTEFKQ
jgi:HPt (histidine-containing phosphotransfer) domain-containing protein